LEVILGLLVTFCARVAVPFLLGWVGGWEGLQSKLPADHFTVLGPLRLEQAMGFLLPTMLLMIGNQPMYQKFFSARSERDARLAVFGWILGTVVLETAVIAIAVIGSAQFQTERPREIIPLTARLGMPELAGAFLLGGIFAKVISTANNYLFSPASNLIHDVYQRFIRPDAGERKVLIVSRLLVVLLGVFALLQAAYFESILKAALYAYTVYGAAVTPSVMAVFFWKRANAAGAVGSIIAGTLITVAWNVAGIQVVDAVYPALGVSLLALVAVSLATTPPAKEKWERFR
jgi:SSS family solute:Na+ symporter/sodium/proline symporter